MDQKHSPIDRRRGVEISFILLFQSERWSPFSWIRVDWLGWMPAVSSIRLNHSAAAAAPQDTIEAKRELHNRIREYSAFRGFALQIFVRRIEDLNLLINHCGGTYNSSRITAGTAGCWLAGWGSTERSRTSGAAEGLLFAHTPQRGNSIWIWGKRRKLNNERDPR